MADLIQPRTLKGFRDYLPDLMMPREHLLEQARRVYRSYGFRAPLIPRPWSIPRFFWARGGKNPTSLFIGFAIMGTGM